MASEAIRLAGIHQLAPEEFYCALFIWSGHDRILPVWLSPIDGARIDARLAGFEHRRPDTYDTLIDAVEQLGGVEAVTISHYHEGVFMVDVELGNDTQLDTRVSDALVLANHFGVDIVADSDVLQETTVYATAADLREYFGLDVQGSGSDDGGEDAGASDGNTNGGSGSEDGPATKGQGTGDPGAAGDPSGAERSGARESGPDAGAARSSGDESAAAERSAGGDQESTSASGDAQADAEFSEMLRSLGLSEEDLGHDDPENDPREDN